MNLSRDLLDSMMRNLPPDPLLDRGIGKDWVAVINPVHLRDLLNATEPFPQEYPAMSDERKLEIRIGRQLYVLTIAPTGGVEYLDPIGFAMKYGEHVSLLNRIAREAQEHRQRDDSETNSLESNLATGSSPETSHPD